MVDEDRVARIEEQFDGLDSLEEGTGWRGRVSWLIGTVRRIVVWNRSIVKRSLVDGVLIGGIVEWLVGSAGFSELTIPFFAVAFDLNGNPDVIIGEGDLAPALRASSAIPGSSSRSRSAGASWWMAPSSRSCPPRPRAGSAPTSCWP